MPRRLPALLLLTTLLGGCVTSQTVSRTQTWAPAQGQGWERPGRVESIRETVTQTRGDPAAGAFGGAVIGSIFGSIIGGAAHGYYGSGWGALAGAAAGAAVGAGTSSAAATEHRAYEVFVQFNDGERRIFVYRNMSPFRVGDEVVLTGRGLEPLSPPAATPPPSAPPQSAPPPPPQAAPPAPSPG